MCQMFKSRYTKADTEWPKCSGTRFAGWANIDHTRMFLVLIYWTNTMHQTGLGQDTLGQHRMH